MSKSVRKKKFQFCIPCGTLFADYCYTTAIKMCREKHVNEVHARKLSRTEHTRSHHMVAEEMRTILYIQNLLMVTIWLSVKIITREEEKNTQNKETRSERKIWKK